MAKVSTGVATVSGFESDSPNALAIMVTAPAVAPVTVVVKTPLELAVPEDEAILTAPAPD